MSLTDLPSAAAFSSGGRRLPDRRFDRMSTISASAGDIRLIYQDGAGRGALSNALTDNIPTGQIIYIRSPHARDVLQDVAGWGRVRRLRAGLVTLHSGGARLRIFRDY